MVVFSLIGETLTDFEHRENTALLRTLTSAIGAVSPKGCSLRVILAKGRELPIYDDPRISAVPIPLRAGSLPLLWQNGASARPLDGELMHSVTPLAPLRARNEEDGSQTTVTVPHMLPWQDPDRYSGTHLRAIRSFIKRAVKHADVVVTPNYATADLLTEYFGPQVNVQVLPFAPLPEYVAGADQATRAQELELPENYLVTTARPDSVGRLQWLVDAVKNNDAFPPLVVIGEVGGETTPPENESESASTEPETSEPETTDAAEETTAEAATPAAPIYKLPPELENHPNLQASDTNESKTDAEPQPDAATKKAAKPRPTKRAKPEQVDPLAEIVANSDGRVIVVHPRELEDIGAILGGATLLVLPQAAIGVGHEVYGAIANGVPVLHAELGPVDEIALDAARTFDSAESLAATLDDVLSDDKQQRDLKVLAHDRANFFSWPNVAWSLWELHANL